jgi:hypothetical protein
MARSLAEGAVSPQLDPSLQRFADPAFDPVDFLNESLPPLTLASSQPHAARVPGAIPLAELSTRSQSLLSELSAQNVRLSGILTQLTDEILRSGRRLAYEVEVLRGEAIGLSDALTETLHDEVQKLTLEKLDAGMANPDVAGPPMIDEADENLEAQDAKAIASEPPFITQLRTLYQVRERLEQVVQVFGEAMEWPLPPSEMSIASSFISVSAPEFGPEHHSQEEKGEEAAKKLRSDISSLLEGNGGGEAGLEAAAQRLASLRALSLVWKGTAEEKARTRFVEGLAKMVEDRRKTLENQAKDRDRERPEPSPRRAASKRSGSSMDRTPEDRSKSDGGGPGGGLLRNLQRLRDEIYLE